MSRGQNTAKKITLIARNVTPSHALGGTMLCAIILTLLMSQWNSNFSDSIKKRTDEYQVINNALSGHYEEDDTIFPFTYNFDNIWFILMEFKGMWNGRSWSRFSQSVEVAVDLEPFIPIRRRPWRDSATLNIVLNAQPFLRSGYRCVCQPIWWCVCWSSSALSNVVVDSKNTWSTVVMYAYIFTQYSIFFSTLSLSTIAGNHYQLKSICVPLLTATLSLSLIPPPLPPPLILLSPLLTSPLSTIHLSPHLPTLQPSPHLLLPTSHLSLPFTPLLIFTQLFSLQICLNPPMPWVRMLFPPPLWW